MGGKSLKIYTERKSTDEYYKIYNEIKKYFIKYDIFATKFFRDKKDHGDLDILIKSNNINKIYDICFNIKNNEIKKNGNIITFDYNDFQIDIICIDNSIWEISKVFYSYDPIGNLMGKIAHGFGLKYGFNGLVYKSVGKQSVKTITLTKDPQKIFNFLGYDFNIFKKGFNTLYDIFNYIINGKFYDKELFQPENLKNYDRKRSLKRKSYRLFLEFSKNTTSKYHFNGNYVEYIDNWFNGFKNKISEHKNNEDRIVIINNKFRKLIKKFKYSKTLKECIFYYKNIKKDFLNFIENNSIDDIFNDFKIFYLKYLELDKMIDKELGFGKKMGSSLYIHKDYMNELPKDILYQNLKYLPEIFDYTIIKWNKVDNSMSFIKSTGFDILDEPIIDDSYKIKDGIIKYRKKPNKDQIYHHKWMFVKSNYNNFNYIKSKIRSLKWYKNYNYNSKMIGYKDYWDSLKITESYTNDEKKIANKTSRLNKNNGAIGLKSVVLNYVKNNINKSNSILDYGSGKYPLHTFLLRKMGFNVTPYDFGENLTDLHDANALNKKYDVIFASNVLNVQSSLKMLHLTLNEIIRVMKVNSIFITNYPKTPRKLRMTDNDLINILNKYFIVRKIKKNIFIMKLKNTNENFIKNFESYSMIIKNYNLNNKINDLNYISTKNIDWDDIFNKKNNISSKYIKPYEKRNFLF